MLISTKKPERVLSKLKNGKRFTRSDHSGCFESIAPRMSGKVGEIVVGDVLGHGFYGRMAVLSDGDGSESGGCNVFDLRPIAGLCAMRRCGAGRCVDGLAVLWEDVLEFVGSKVCLDGNARYVIAHRSAEANTCLATWRPVLRSSWLPRMSTMWQAFLSTIATIGAIGANEASQTSPLNSFIMVSR